MSDEPSPRPWKYGETVDRGCLIIDATGRCLANTQYGINNDMATNRANAQLICTAVNERERLRDIVRRLVDLFTPETIHPAGTMERLLREARAAIGEEKP